MVHGVRSSRREVECNLVDRANERARLETFHAGGGWRMHLVRFEKELHWAFREPRIYTHG